MKTEKFKYYPEPFDITKPPPSPPAIILNKFEEETVESIARRGGYRERLKEYSRAIANGVKESLDNHAKYDAVDAEKYVRGTIEKWDLAGVLEEAQFVYDWAMLPPEVCFLRYQLDENQRHERFQQSAKTLMDFVVRQIDSHLLASTLLGSEKVEYRVTSLEGCEHKNTVHSELEGLTHFELCVDCGLSRSEDEQVSGDWQYVEASCKNIARRWRQIQIELERCKQGRSGQIDLTLKQATEIEKLETEKRDLVIKIEDLQRKQKPSPAGSITAVKFISAGTLLRVTKDGLVLNANSGKEVGFTSRRQLDEVTSKEELDKLTQDHPAETETAPSEATTKTKTGTKSVAKPAISKSRGTSAKKSSQYPGVSKRQLKAGKVSWYAVLGMGENRWYGGTFKDEIDAAIAVQQHLGNNNAVQALKNKKATAARLAELEAKKTQLNPADNSDGHEL